MVESTKLNTPDVKDPLIETLDREEDEGMARTKAWAGIWQENLRYFFSDQLHGKKLHKDWDWVVVNYIWPTAIQELAKLSRNYPRLIADPRDDSDTDFAETWQGILQWLWEKGLNNHGMRIEQIRAIFDGKLYGYRISKVYWEDMVQWDDDAKEWHGDVRHRLWHPAEFWSSETEFIDEGNCGTRRYVDLEYAKHRWPDYETKLEEKALSYREAIGGGEGISGQTGSAGTYPSTGSGTIDKGVGPNAPTALLTRILAQDKTAGIQGAPEEDKKFIKLSEAYRKDYTTTKEKREEDIPQEELRAAGMIRSDNGIFTDLDGNPIESRQWPRRLVKKWDQPTYPQGRYIIRSDGIILNPKQEDQVYPYTRWPFIIAPHYLLPHMWQGVDGVQLYKTSQDMINVTVTHLTNNLKQFGDPRIAIESGAIATPPGRKKRKFKVFTGAGAVIRLVRGGIKRYKIEPPVPPSPSALMLYQLFAQEYKNLQGMQDIAMGKETPGQKTLGETQILAISANDRIHLQSVFEDEWVKEVATLVAEVCQKNYSAGRMVRIVGEDRIRSVTEITQELRNVKFDVDVEVGQTLPFDEEKRIAKYKLAYEMMQNPIANPMLPEMLRELEIRGWQKLLKKYEAWQLYYQFYQLYEQVVAGEVDPQDAVKMLVQKAVEVYAAEQRETVPTVEEKEGQNAGNNNQS